MVAAFLTFMAAVVAKSADLITAAEAAFVVSMACFNMLWAQECDE
jgi:hypothetical protein